MLRVSGTGWGWKMGRWKDVVDDGEKSINDGQDSGYLYHTVLATKNILVRPGIDVRSNQKPKARLRTI
jgi:hypothetical protein